MTDLTIAEYCYSYEYPPYSKPGRILVRITPLDDPEFEVLDYDHDSSVFWINECTGFDWWLEHHDWDIPPEGVYVIEGVTGEYIRGDGWMTDDREVWEHQSVRLASDWEIEHQMLITPIDYASITRTVTHS